MLTKKNVRSIDGQAYENAHWDEHNRIRFSDPHESAVDAFVRGFIGAVVYLGTAIAIGFVLAAFVGCAAGDVDGADDVLKTGTVEQESINQFRTDNRHFTMAFDGLDPIRLPSQSGSPSNLPCGRGSWGTPPLGGWAFLGSVGPAPGLLLPDVRDMVIQLDSILEPNATLGRGVCPMTSRNTAICPGTVCPFPRPQSHLYGISQQAQSDPWSPDFQVSYAAGSAGGALAVENNQTSVDGKTRLGYHLTLNIVPIKAIASQHGTAEITVVRWLLCRHIGRAVGLNTRSSTANTCMGNQPTNAAQWLARDQWDDTDKSEIRSVYLSRTATAPEL